MKKFFCATTALFVFSLCSCTKVVHSHKTVMQRYHTKSQVANEFGVPSEKRQDKDFEEWLYSFGARAKKTKSEKIDPDNSVKNDNNVFDTTRSITKNVDKFNTYDSYVKFTFNQDSTVRNWDSKGVDYSERKNSAVAIGLSVAVLLILLGAIFAPKWE